ncbi:MAG: hypothetical protein Q9M48_10425 [Rhodobacterales bacterium]|nr:hypothetical protein [Rhodobacterales bacterium]
MNWAAILCKARGVLLFALVLATSLFALYSVRASAQTPDTRATTPFTNCTTGALVRKSQHNDNNDS